MSEVLSSLIQKYIDCNDKLNIDNNPLQFVIVKGEDRSRKKEVLSQNDLNKLVNKLREKINLNMIHMQLLF